MSEWGHLMIPRHFLQQQHDSSGGGVARWEQLLAANLGQPSVAFSNSILL